MDAIDWPLSIEPFLQRKNEIMKRVSLSLVIAGMIVTGAFAQPPRDGGGGRKGKGAAGEEVPGQVGNGGPQQGAAGQRGQAGQGAQGFGGQGQGRGMGFMMRPGIILPEPLIDQLQATPEQRAAIAKLQATVDAELAKILSPMQLQALQQMGRGPQGFGQGGAGGQQGFGQQGFGQQGAGGQGFGVPGEGGPGFGKGGAGQGGKGGAGQKGQGKGGAGAGDGKGR